MGLGFSKGKGSSSESWGRHGWEEPTQEIRQFLNDPEIEKSAKAIAQAAGEAARKAAYDTAYTLSKEKVDEAKSKLEKNLSVVEAQKAQLELKLEEQTKDIKEYKRAIAELTNQVDHAARREVELKKMEKQLQEEKEALDEEKREILGIGAPAYQARKMYGDTVPGDITHTDVASKFSEFFKNYIRRLPQNNPDVSAENVKKLITPLFQEAFTMSCQHAMKIIQKQALTLFNDPSEMTEEQKSSHRVKEQQLDTSRAYSLLLYHADVKGRKESIIEELKIEMKSHLCDIAAKEGIKLPDELITAAATITWEMVTLIPPAISCTPRKFDKHYHEQRNALWKVKKGPYELIYTRPVLFFGSDGHVGMAGQVGNKPCDPEGAINFNNENSDDEDDEPEQSQNGNEDLQQPPQQESQDSKQPQQENKDSQQPQQENKDSQQPQQGNEDSQQPQQGNQNSPRHQKEKEKDSQQRDEDLEENQGHQDIPKSEQDSLDTEDRDALQSQQGNQLSQQGLHIDHSHSEEGENSQQSEQANQLSPGDHEHQGGTDNDHINTTTTTTIKDYAKKTQPLSPLENETVDNTKTTDDVPQPIVPTIDKLVGADDETPENEKFLNVVVEADNDRSPKFVTDGQVNQEGSPDIDGKKGTGIYENFAGGPTNSLDEDQQAPSDKMLEEKSQEKPQNDHNKKENKSESKETEEDEDARINVSTDEKLDASTIGVKDSSESSSPRKQNLEKKELVSDDDNNENAS